MANPSIIHRANLHLVIFLWPLVCIIAPLTIMFNLPANLRQLENVFYFISAFGVIWSIVTWFSYQFSSLVIKSNRVIVRTGFFMRQTTDIPLNKIESIDIKQTIIGSLLRYGELTIVGTGGTRNIINFLDKPLTCRRIIEQQMHHSSSQ